MKKAWNSKMIVIALIAVLLVSLALTGCQQNPAQPTEPGNETAATKPADTKPQATKPTEPPKEAFEVYWNVDKLKYMPADNTDGVSTRKPEADGTYSVNFVYKGKNVTKKIKADAQLINKIDALQVIGDLVLDASDVVTGIKTVEEIGGKIVSNGTYVYKFNGSTIIVNPEKDFSAKAENFKVEYSTYVLDVTTETAANLYELLKCDQVVIVADKYNDLSHIFMYNPSEIRVGRTAYCAHCQKEVHWDTWIEDDVFPTETSGHYYLYDDITLTYQQSMAANTQLILDLNGKSIRRTTGMEEDTTGRVISLHNDNCYLAIMDSSEEKTGRISGTGEAYALGTCVWVRKGQFDFYSGTIDASEILNSSRGTAVEAYPDAVFNMHGGTIIGGTSQSRKLVDGTYTAGGRGGSVYVEGTFNMYGGEIYGGTADNGEADLFVEDGGVFNQTGGQIGKATE